MLQEIGNRFEATWSTERIERAIGARSIAAHPFDAADSTAPALIATHVDHGSFKKALGSVIYQLRRERKLSQEQLALEAEVDRTRTGEIERGEANPTVDTLTRIADVLGYTLGTLIVRAELIAYKEVSCR